jgi:pimeloyl-ACP methyl ester carboxylesterase
MITLPDLSRRSLLYLHGDDGPHAAAPFVDALRANLRNGHRDADVVAPTCPGWTAEPIPVWLRTVDQLAYHYLDALDRAAAQPVVAVGASFGAWLLLEMATKQPRSFAALVLVSPIGVKLNDRETAQFRDLFVRDIEARAALLYSDATRAAQRQAQLDDPQMLELTIAQEALTRYGWEPFLHNPLLRHRLHRITCPTVIVHGADDRLVASIDYYQRLGELLRGTTELITIAGAGHRVEEEQPDELARRVGDYVRALR